MPLASKKTLERKLAELRRAELSLRTKSDGVKRKTVGARFCCMKAAEMAIVGWVHKHFPWMTEWAQSMKVEGIFGAVIVLNCITIGIEVHACPPPSSTRVSDHCPEAFVLISEHVCTAVFLLEFFLRSFSLGFSYYFRTWAHVMDMILIGIGVLVGWVLPPFIDPGNHIRFLTALRSFRLFRIARIMRFQAKEMWLLLSGIAKSAKAMISMVLVLLGVTYFFGIVAIVLVGDSPHLANDEELLRFFSGLDQVMLTLFQVLTLDGWASEIARPVMSVMPGMVFFFLLYITVGVLVIMNIFTAVFVERAFQTSREDDEQMLDELNERRESVLLKLHDIFERVDASRGGEISMNDFFNVMTTNPEIADTCKLLGLDGLGQTEALEQLFEDVDSGEGSLSLEQFFAGLRTLEGRARNRDVIRTQKSVQRVEQRLNDLCDMIDPDGTQRCQLRSTRKRSRSSSVHSRGSKASQPSRRASLTGFSNLDANDVEGVDVHLREAGMGIWHTSGSIPEDSITADGSLTVDGARSKTVPVQSCSDNQNFHSTSPGSTGGSVPRVRHALSAAIAQEVQSQLLAGYVEIGKFVSQRCQAEHMEWSKSLTDSHEFRPPARTPPSVVRDAASIYRIEMGAGPPHALEPDFFSNVEHSMDDDGRALIPPIELSHEEVRFDEVRFDVSYPIPIPHGKDEVQGSSTFNGCCRGRTPPPVSRVSSRPQRSSMSRIDEIPGSRIPDRKGLSTRAPQDPALPVCRGQQEIVRVDGFSPQMALKSPPRPANPPMGEDVNVPV